MGNQLGGYHGGEAVGLAELCERIVRFPATELAMPAAKIRKNLAKWVNANRRQAAERNTIGGGKYPHLCVLGDHLRGICGDSLRVISIDRPLEESIESLKRRSHKATGWLGVSDDQAEAVQRWLWEGKQSFLKSQKHLAVSYAELLDNPVAQCDRIVDYLELEPTAEQYQAALALVDKSKRHVTLPASPPRASTLPRCHDCGHQFTAAQLDSTSSGQLCPRCLSGNVDEPANRTTYPKLPVRTGLSFVPSNQLPPPATPPPRVRTLAFVTSFFNPHCSLNRVKIFPQFAASLARCGVPLFCIEGLFPGSASQVDSDWEVKIDAEAVFWHKEPLLQLAIDWLSDEYDAVCWIDSDVILYADDIGDRILDSLSRHAVVQPWSEIQYLGPQGNPISQWQRSMAFANRCEPLPNADPRHSFPGMAWACSRELLSRVGGMYTRCITGGGDVAWAAAAWNDADIVRSHAWSAALQADVINWGTTLTTATRGRVGFVDSRASHLYHGRLAHRQYAERNAIFKEVNFDPQAHLERAPNGTLRWSRFAPVELREWIARYMHSRREDE
jgi:predicted Zn-ribbon and HTH transcriptional regulator